MGLPAGHVTAVPGLTRNDQLKALGNGVVPQQAALATHIWAATMQGTYPTATTQEDAALLPTPDANMGNGGRTRSEIALREGNRQTNLDDLPRVLTMQLEPTGTDDGRLW
jgi:hypothetical protein